MSEELQRFVRNNAVQSKLSGQPIAAQHDGQQFVFIHGYPMTLRGFYTIASKAIFGASVHLASRKWEELHAETLLLCIGLSVELQKDREAFSVLRGIRLAMNWTKETYDKERILQWIDEVEKQVDRCKKGE